MDTTRWVPKWSRDAATDTCSPVPMEVVSNEEYAPLRPTADQRRAAAIFRETTARHARRLGMGRREFLASSAGMAAEFLAYNAVFGMLIQTFGADHVLWGTDSIWWGSPRWQIEAFRRFTMPEPLMQRFGYRPLTPEVKTAILGLNAALLCGVDPAAHRAPMPPDFVSKLKAAYRDLGPRSSLTQYGWVLSG